MAGRSLKHLPNPAKSQTTPVSWCGRLEDPLINETGSIVQTLVDANCAYCYRLANDAAATTT